ncbi:hypothetical protein POM88_035554 [Heracleum sosnowskyi]|uniref:Uncharacterized protein n=1 Tax=Heracleum sosnowskyi TaxID=360622 RepID=A0AAD8HNJ7_9APIA|nr:hypothetical protein POM88_035554 [Heracleum sosnowskyi]
MTNYHRGMSSLFILSLNAVFPHYFLVIWIKAKFSIRYLSCSFLGWLLVYWPVTCTFAHWFKNCGNHIGSKHGKPSVLASVPFLGCSTKQDQCWINTKCSISDLHICHIISSFHWCNKFLSTVADQFFFFFSSEGLLSIFR